MKLNKDIFNASKTKKIAAGFVLSATALGAGAGVASAETTHSAPPVHHAISQTSAKTQAGSDFMKTELDKLVKNKTITSAQETSILSQFKADSHKFMMDNNKGMGNKHFMREGHDFAKLTPAQKTAIKNARMGVLEKDLKLTPAQLQADMKNHVKISDLAKKAGIPPKTLHKDIHNAVKPLLPKPSKTSSPSSTSTTSTSGSSNS